MNKQSFTDFEIIFVDNGSTDGSVEFVERNFPGVRVVRNSRNLGQTGGWNRGISVSKGRYLVFLDNDTEVAPEWLQEMVRIADLDREVGICTSKVMYFGSKKLINACGCVVDTYGGTWNRGSGEEDYGQYDGEESREVFAAYGASWLVKKEVIEKIGGFDDDFFAYYEETDFCWRARLIGYKVRYVSTSKTRHITGMTAGRSEQATWKKAFYFYTKNKVNALIKNYEFENVLKRLPIVLFLHSAQSLLYSMLYDNIEVFKWFISGIIWNLKVLPKTLEKRRRIQAYRKVPDKSLEKIMYSGHLWLRKHRISELLQKNRRQKVPVKRKTIST